MNKVLNVCKYYVENNKREIITLIVLGGIGTFGIQYGIQNYKMKKQNSQIQNCSDKPNDTQKENEKSTNENTRIEIKEIKKSQLLEQIYDQTIRARDVPDEFKPFISDEKQLEYLLDEYGMNNEKVKESLKSHLKGMRRARGDGNCFYTSFGFQYLGYILNKASDEQFEDFIKLVCSLPFSVIHSDQMYEKNEEMNQIFIDHCRFIRGINLENRENEFYKLFSNPEGQFYGLTIIFLRNLTYKFCFEDEETKATFEAIELNLQQQILTWEYDCENNQSVINLLSRKLLIDIILYYVEEDKYKLNVQEYKTENQQILLKVYLLFRPGHYNVAIHNN